MAGIEQFDAATGISDLAIVENLQNAVDIIGRRIAIIIGEADDVTARTESPRLRARPNPGFASNAGTTVIGVSALNFWMTAAVSSVAALSTIGLPIGGRPKLRIAARHF